MSDGRHRTLRDAIGWSYDLCTEAERALWARLSVFAGAFNVAAAREVCASAGLDEDDILETIIRLVDKSVLVRVQPATVGVPDEDQPAWYRMLDTIHEFGGEMLSASGSEDAVRDRFIARYLAKAQYFAEHLTDEAQLERFRELRREHSNLAGRAPVHARRRASASGYRQGAELANALYGYWHMAGLLREGRYWYRKVLDTLPDASTLERGWALASRGYLGAMQGEAAEAVADGQRGHSDRPRTRRRPAHRPRLIFVRRQPIDELRVRLGLDLRGALPGAVLDHERGPVHPTSVKNDTTPMRNIAPSKTLLDDPQRLAAGASPARRTAGSPMKNAGLCATSGCCATKVASVG